MCQAMQVEGGSLMMIYSRSKYQSYRNLHLPTVEASYQWIHLKSKLLFLNMHGVRLNTYHEYLAV